MEPTSESFEAQPSFKRFILPVFGLLALVLVGLVIVKATLKPKSDVVVERIDLQEGADLPNLSFQTGDGTVKTLEDYAGKTLLINFWATWCEACMVEMPSMVQLRAAMGDHFEIIAINVDENPARAIPDTQKKFGINFVLAQDPEGKLAEAFDIHAIPLSVLVDKDRKILMVESGERDWYDEDTQAMVRSHL